MNIQCNEQEMQIEAETLAAALVELGYESKVVATALNGEFVPKAQRESTMIRTGDRIDVLAPMQGG